MTTAAPRVCPVCGENQRKVLLYTQRFAVPSTQGVHGGYDVVVCGRCGMAYANDPPSQAFFDTYYGALAKKDEMLDPATDFAESDSTVRRNNHSLVNILPHVRPAARVLEVGCYTGYLLSRIQAEVPTAEIIGLDPSAFAATVGRHRHGVDIRVGSVFDDLSLGRFDCIIAMHVLEHVVEPRQLVARLRALLADGGCLYVEVPDATRFHAAGDDSEQRAEPFFEFNFEHINYFSTKSLDNLMRLNGFSMIDMSRQTSTLPIIASTWSSIALAKDSETMTELQRYVKESSVVDADIAQRIRTALASSDDVIVWGAGAHTQRLVSLGLIDPATVRAFVDSNPAYGGAFLAGKPIVLPEQISQYPDLPIVISSHRFEREIAANIRAIGVGNPIVTLYS